MISPSILSAARFASRRHAAASTVAAAALLRHRTARSLSSIAPLQPVTLRSTLRCFSSAAPGELLPRHTAPSVTITRHLPASPSGLRIPWLLRRYSVKVPSSQTPTDSRPSSIPRHLFNKTRRKRPVQLRSKGSVDNPQKPPSSGSSTANQAPKGKTAPATETSKATKIGAAASARQRQLLDRLPNITQHFHRPTKEELLAAATGFWSRLRVRFKWFSIRSLRPFNLDDISAFFSWVLVGHLIWILVGTTTFVSLLIFTLNTVFAQETLARWVGDYLTKSLGIKVVFESAIVPKWRDGVITFKNVFVSRRPGQETARVSKGSQEAAAAAAAELASERVLDEGEDNNYTQFDLSIENVNVTLSLVRWFNSKGLLKDVEIKGVRGVVDRTAVENSGDDVDPKSFRKEHSPGDFEIESFRLEDLLLSVYQPNKFRPFSVSVYSADLPQLRKQWLFYDILSANYMSGSFDDSLFTIHPRQTHNFSGAQHSDGIAEGDPSTWKKQSRIRIDGLAIDHLNRGVEGPFSWIHTGNVDIAADVMFPADSNESIAKLMAEFYDRLEASVTNGRYLYPARPRGTDTVDNPTSSPESSTNAAQQSQEPATQNARYLVVDLRINLTSVRASVPLFTRDISYINQALIRPIVAYINSHSSSATPLNQKPFIPIACRVVKPVGDFDGSWTIFDSGLMDDISQETYEAFAAGATDQQKRGRRIRKVGWWTVQLAAQALFLGLAGNVA